MKENVMKCYMVKLIYRKEKEINFVFSKFENDAKKP